MEEMKQRQQLREKKKQLACEAESCDDPTRKAVLAGQLASEQLGGARRCGTWLFCGCLGVFWSLVFGQETAPTTQRPKDQKVWSYHLICVKLLWLLNFII